MEFWGPSTRGAPIVWRPRGLRDHGIPGNGDPFLSYGGVPLFLWRHPPGWYGEILAVLMAVSFPLLWLLWRHPSDCGAGIPPVFAVDPFEC